MPLLSPEFPAALDQIQRVCLLCEFEGPSKNEGACANCGCLYCVIASTESLAPDIVRVKEYDEEGQRIFSTIMKRKIALQLDDLAKNAKASLAIDVH